jgi:hypothetical protein
MIQKLVKCFRFEEKNRRRFIFSDSTKIRLNPITNRIELSQIGYNRATGEPLYSTDTDLYVATWVTNPTAIRQWAGFSHDPLERNQPDNTTVRFKLNDGTDDRYWGGATWDVAGASNWNTEAEIAANISTFPVIDQKLGVIVNLQTTDPKVTPFVTAVDILMSCEIDYLYSLIGDALLSSLEASFKPMADFAVRAEGGDKISLKDQETPFDVIDVPEAYDHDSDPNHFTNIASAYDVTSKVLTLSSSVERGTTVWFRFTFQARIYLNWPSQDYIEVEKLPAVIVDSFDIKGNEIYAEALVRDMPNFQATVRRFPFRLNLEFDIVLLAEKNRTLLIMMDLALKHVADNPLLHWPAVDESVSMRIVTEGLFRPRPNLDDIHSTRYSLMIEDIHLWLRTVEVKPLVQRFNLSLSDPSLQGGPRWTGVK